MFEDDPPAPKPLAGASRVARPVLDGWGVVELRTYVDDLRAEIARAQEAIEAKESHRSGADALFRRPTGDPT